MSTFWKFCLVFGALTTIASGQESSSGAGPAWPQWRGPHRDGSVDTGVSWPATLDPSVLKSRWEVELAPSYSGPIVFGDRVYVTETVNRKQEVVKAIDRETGAVTWRTAWAGAMSVPFFAAANGSWIRSTPACDGDALYVAGMRDVLVCLDAATGRERWRIDFVADLGTKLPSFGFVSSPLVVGQYVYVQAAEGLVKVDKRSGEIVWRSLVDGGGMSGSAFSSPVSVMLDGRPLLLVQAREFLAGVDPDSGEELWRQKIEAFRGMNIVTPTVYEDQILTSSYGGATILLDPPTGKSGDVRQVWKNKVQGYMSSPIVIDGHAYLHLRNQRMACINLETGKEAWISKPFGKYWSLVAQGSRILALDERGDLLLIEATPEEFRILDTRHVTDAPSWAHLAVVNDEVYVRDLERLIRFDWTEESTKTLQ